MHCLDFANWKEEVGKLPKAGWREKVTGNDVISLWYLVPLKTQDYPIINTRSMQFISLVRSLFGWDEQKMHDRVLSPSLLLSCSYTHTHTYSVTHIIRHICAVIIYILNIKHEDGVSKCSVIRIYILYTQYQLYIERKYVTVAPLLKKAHQNRRLLISFEVSESTKILLSSFRNRV